MAARVEVDTTELDAAFSSLSRGLTVGGRELTTKAATKTASEIRGKVPVRSGRLAATVGTRPDGLGTAVTYGGGLPYARYIEKRTNAVGSSVEGARAEYTREAFSLAAREARKL